VTAGERRAFVATFVAASSLIFALCGLVLLALGRLRLTKVLNFLPYPVRSRVQIKSSTRLQCERMRMF